MFCQAINAIDFQHHVDDVDFNDLFAIDGQLVVRAFGGHLGGAALALLVFTAIKLFVTAAHDDFDGGDFAGIIALIRAGKAQRHAVRARRGILCPQRGVRQTANGPLQRQGIIVQVNRDRARHAATAILLQLAGKFG